MLQRQPFSLRLVEQVYELHSISRFRIWKEGIIGEKANNVKVFHDHYKDAVIDLMWKMLLLRGHMIATLFS
jgi:hypothetical protein